MMYVICITGTFYAGVDVVRHLAEGGAAARQRFPQQGLCPDQHRRSRPARQPQHSSGEAPLPPPPPPHSTYPPLPLHPPPPPPPPSPLARKSASNAVLRIHDILIRFRIFGSVHWFSDPDPAFFGSGFQDTIKKIDCFSSRLCLFPTVGLLTWSSLRDTCR
jgi:hypothetical protein